ncbi:serine hydrolase [Nocardia terpenica]|uniref:hypothetical protein n=1 Tax=Nocardia terpenica TaxID=455432 RepID=UPI002B4B8E08|nr:hypothetical protein [Nocardia terpenica]
MDAPQSRPDNRFPARELCPLSGTFATGGERGAGTATAAAGPAHIAGRRRTIRPGKRIRVLLTALCCGALLLVPACSSHSDPGPAATIARPSAPSGTGAVVALPGSLAADFADLLPSLNGHAGMAIQAVGGDRPVTMGNWTTGPAWSTMKVPLALAVLRTNGNTGTYQMSAAITESDNTAADGLWQSLGTPDAAAQAVQAVLRDGGDTTTTVPATRARPDYSAFGQATWALADQARFTAHLPCLPGADTVTTLMSKVVWGQQWGLGHLDNAQYKGGWGPDPNGNYLVRQLGLVTTPGGEMAIALAAQANSGSFTEGTQMLDKMVTLIGKHLGELPVGHCPGAH